MNVEKKQKPKPPRPPAPNLSAKKNIKKQASSGLSFSFNDLKSVDSDDDDRSFTQFAKPDTQDAFPSTSSMSKKPKELQPLSNPDSKAKEMKPMSFPRNGSKSSDLDSLGSLEDICNEASQPPGARSSGLSKPVVVEQVKNVQEEVLRSSPTTKMKESGQPDDGARIRPKLQKGGSGVLKVATEVLEENENESFKLPCDSQEALADPLSFLDKVMEDQLGSSYEDEDDFGSRRSLRRSDNSSSSISSMGAKRTLKQQRAKSLDVEIGEGKEKNGVAEKSLDINPCYFTVPTPSELKEEPVRKSDSMSNLKGVPKAQPKIISLSGLLASPNAADDDGERQSMCTGSDGVRTPEKPPSDSDWVKVERKPTSDSPLTVSSQVQSPEEEVKIPQGDAPVPLPPLPVYTLLAFTFLIFAYFMFPLPVYLSGFLLGLFSTFYLMLFLVWINLPPRDKSFLEDEDSADSPLVIPGPRMTAAKVKFKVQEKAIFKGWMNELSSVPYDPETYHVNQTHSILVRLEGHTLRLSRPKQNIAKRAMFDEPTPRPEYVHQRIYDIRGSSVYLQPEGLVKKRLWSKKYPLCIELPKKGMSVEKKDLASPDDTAQDLGFNMVQKEECDDKLLVLFARTGREKEEWFWRFEAAAQLERNGNSRSRPIQTLHKGVFLVGNDFIDNEGNQVYRGDPEDITSRKATVDFYKFLSKIMPKEKESKDNVVPDVKAKAGGVTYATPGPRPGASAASAKEGGGLMSGLGNDAPVAWVNALIGRYFWDFLREERWAEIIQTKLQKKLSKIKIPHFMEALTITGTDLGLNAPTIRKASRPTVDARGMWVDLDVHYGGSCWMTLTTKFNLWKLGKDTRMEREMEDMMSGKKEGIEKLERNKKRDVNSNKKPPSATSTKAVKINPCNPYAPPAHYKPRKQMSAALDSDEEDSAESSDDEPPEETISTTSSELGVPSPEEGMKSSSKILRFVSKVANSNYFQRATQNKYVKRAFNEVSNTTVELTVEVKELRGVLAVNIPPPPSDRLWYGFRGKPRLWLSAKPKLGTRQVTITHITEYIERKLEKEFQKVFVLPNMDDIPVPIMEFKIDENRFPR